jgi:hypothetical protein
VDRAGTPFAHNDLRDGSTYYAVKKSESFEKQSNVRGFSVFTVNQVAQGHRFMIRCGNDIRHVWLPFATPGRIRDICEMIWGDANFKWNSDDLQEIDGKVLHITKMKGRPDDRKMIQFKIRFEDKPGKPQEMIVHSWTGTHISTLCKTLQSLLWGRDYYLDTLGAKNVAEQWAGKSFRVMWRFLGGAYKEDSWENKREERDIICKDLESTVYSKEGQPHQDEHQEEQYAMGWDNSGAWGQI